MIYVPGAKLAIGVLFDHLQTMADTGNITKGDDNVLRAFSVEHASIVTALSPNRLARWDCMGIFSPEYAEEDRSAPYSRVYSFTDLVGLKTLALLTDVHHVPLSEVRRSYKALKEHVARPWTDTQLSVFARKIVFSDPATGQPRNASDGQFIGEHIDLMDIRNSVRRETEKLRSRDNEDIGQTEKHKFVSRNAEVVAGTRIPVSIIEAYLEDGFSDEQIIEAYPSLTVRDVQAVRKSVKAA